MLTVGQKSSSSDKGSASGAGGSSGGSGGSGGFESGPPKGGSNVPYLLMASMVGGLVGTAYQMEQSESFAQSVESNVHPHFSIFVLTPLRDFLRASVFESSDAKSVRLANQEQTGKIAQESQRIKDEVAVAAAAVRAKRAGDPPITYF